MSALEIEVLEASAAAGAPAERQRTPLARIDGVLIGTLIAFKEDGRTPLVIYRDQPTAAAIPALAILDLHGACIGRQVVLQFEGGDPGRPIIMGLLRSQASWPLEQPGQVEVDADGARLLVTAKEQLVLRCGKASITLTKAGKVLIHGEYVVSRASGMHRIKGGSVQIN